ncbi:hypothetical protein BASA61_005171 [Batrachochytrium salamandrivorans]|nr:hypothetical protein BASA62_009459 [Batrachochytrium salamandrivorans]KAH6563484.1 hypothetical protein BASA60_010694 [Batrachochytrium salamandrivorans]KAH6590750.1 hypothetical protein BASA61_005171 [Batrachochytrium salamandrivorans]KAH9273479.1 hypothetical protein BASA83_004145 [Batrachochytrium salamandrivorans]
MAKSAHKELAVSLALQSPTQRILAKSPATVLPSISKSVLNSSTGSEIDLGDDTELIRLQMFLGKIASMQYQQALEIANEILRDTPKNAFVEEYAHVLQERIQQLQEAKDDIDQNSDSDDENEDGTDTEENDTSSDDSSNGSTSDSDSDTRSQ